MVEIARYIAEPEFMMKKLTASSGPYNEIFLTFNVVDFVQTERDVLNDITNASDLEKCCAEWIKKLAEVRKITI